MAGTPTPLLVDRSGDLWIGVRASGVQRLAARGFTSYGADDGLETTVANAFITTTRGEFVVAGQGHVLHRFDGRRFQAVALPEPLRHAIVFSLLETQDEDGGTSLWVGGFAGGVARLKNGRWSMLDVFLVAFLAGAVQLGRFASVEPREGIVAFALAVVFTMLATHSFDPHLLWSESPANPQHGNKSQA